MNIDELKLLAGIPYEIDEGIFVRPLTIKKIAEMGESVYNELLGICCFDVDELLKDIPDEEKQELNTFDVVYINYLQDENFRKLFDMAMKVFLGFEINISEDYCFYLGKQVDNYTLLYSINKSNYEDIKQVLKMQNGIGKSEKEEMPEAGNDLADDFMKQMEELKKKYKKHADKKNVLELTDLINAIAWKSGIGIKSVLDMTIYQLHAALKQLNVIDNYENTMFGIYTGNIDTSKMKTKLKDLNWIKEGES